MLEAYGTILLFILVSLGFAVASLIAAALVRPNVQDPVKRTTYECGMEAVGSTEVKTNIRFYVFALLFVIFEVEALYLYPWAVCASKLGITALVQMGVFLGILVAGLAYAWGKGALTWE